MNTIIFDLGGVLLKGTPQSVLDKEPLSNEEYNTLLKFFEDWVDIDLGEESLEDKYLKCNFNDAIEEKYKELLVRYFEKRETNLDLISLAKKLKDNGYNLYVLSDNNKESLDYYRNNALFDMFDGWVVSCEYKTTKKDKKLFKILLDKYTLEPEKCYLIDNNPENIEIAKEYGISGYVYNENDNIESLYKDMINNGINIS
jgi:putative hydrolase of the HAD superfamily